MSFNSESLHLLPLNRVAASRPETHKLRAQHSAALSRRGILLHLERLLLRAAGPAAPRAVPKLHREIERVRVCRHRPGLAPERRRLGRRPRAGRPRPAQLLCRQHVRVQVQGVPLRRYARQGGRTGARASDARGATCVRAPAAAGQQGGARAARERGAAFVCVLCGLRSRAGATGGRLDHRVEGLSLIHI